MAFDPQRLHTASSWPWTGNLLRGTRFSQPLSLATIACINGHLNDLRCYSEEQTRTNIEALSEQLEEVKHG